MRVLKGILKDSLVYYRRMEADLKRQLKKLPKGSVKRRLIKGHVYYYIQWREGRKVIHRYLGKRRPKKFIGLRQKRRLLKTELAKVRASLKLLPRRKIES